MSTYTRARVLGIAGAVGFAAPFLTRCAFAADRVDPNDLKSLATELAAERAAIKAYTDAAALGVVSAPVIAVLNGFLADHNAHRDALIAAYTGAGQTAPADVAPLDTPPLHNENDVLNFAYTVERMLADGHLTAVPLYKNRDYATTAASILGVETTHVALLAEALRRNPAYPSSFVVA
ncbi:MAG: ferritin-like domain-containing protein [Candidatus Eremiobacteraeota bacterium]|nr:ferritin-like domain-containing protein [Candidatus Eremiobacteraeota bacterium]